MSAVSPFQASCPFRVVHHSVSGPRHIERIHLGERVGRLTGSWRSSGKVTLVARDEGEPPLPHASGSNLRNWPIASVCNWHTRGSLTLSMPAISR